MEEHEREFSTRKNLIGTAINTLTPSLPLTAREVRNLGDMLCSGLRGCAHFCHILNEIACLTSASDLPAPANKVCRAKQRTGGGRSWPGGVEAGNLPNANGRGQRLYSAMFGTVRN